MDTGMRTRSGRRLAAPAPAESVPCAEGAGGGEGGPGHLGRGGGGGGPGGGGAVRGRGARGGGGADGAAPGGAAGGAAEPRDAHEVHVRADRAEQAGEPRALGGRAHAHKERARPVAVDGGE